MSVRIDLYRSAIEWCAINDERDNIGFHLTGHPILIALIADVFEVDPTIVALDIELERVDLRKPNRKENE